MGSPFPDFYNPFNKNPCSEVDSGFCRGPLPPPHEDRESDSEQVDELRAGPVMPAVADDFFGSPEATVAAKMAPRGQRLFVFVWCLFLEQQHV